MPGYGMNLPGVNDRWFSPRERMSIPQRMPVIRQNIMDSMDKSMGRTRQWTPYGQATSYQGGMGGGAGTQDRMQDTLGGMSPNQLESWYNQGLTGGTPWQTAYGEGSSGQAPGSSGLWMNTINQMLTGQQVGQSSQANPYMARDQQLGQPMSVEPSARQIAMRRWNY